MSTKYNYKLTIYPNTLVFQAIETAINTYENNRITKDMNFAATLPNFISPKESEKILRSMISYLMVNN